MYNDTLAGAKLTFSKSSPAVYGFLAAWSNASCGLSTLAVGLPTNSIHGGVCTPIR
jgi:hypothetical protein